MRRLIVAASVIRSITSSRLRAVSSHCVTAPCQRRSRAFRKISSGAIFKTDGFGLSREGESCGSPGLMCGILSRHRLN